MNTKYIKEILEQPNAQLIIDKVQEELILEQQKRTTFYEWIDEDIKAEFVNGQVIVHSPVKKGNTDSNSNSNSKKNVSFRKSTRFFYLRI